MAKTKAEIQREYEKRTGYAAQAKYLKERGKSVAFRLIKPQDNDIIEKLESVSSKAGYIKELIRADIAKDKQFYFSRLEYAQAALLCCVISYKPDTGDFIYSQ